jgi:putative salt-induced outer membrane protein YdiY
MTPKTLFWVALCLAGLGLNTPILADELKLKNGDRITGTIVKADSKTLTIKTDYAGMVTVSADAIAQISSAQPLYFALGEGKTVVGKVATKAGKYEVATEGDKLVSLEPAAVQAIRSKSEQEGYERLLSPSWFELWNGGVDFGYSLTTGNTRTNTLALGANLNRRTRRDKTALYAAYINAKNKNKGLTETTANAIRGGGRYEIGMTNRLFAFGFADFEYNQIQLLDLRSVFGGGLSHYLVKRERAEFQLFGGGAYNRENFSDGTRRNAGEILAGEELTFRLSERASFKERLQFFPNLTNRGEYRITFDSSLNTKLTRWLSWQVTASNRYISNPVAGAKNNDLLLTTGIGVTFSDFSFRK